MSMNGGLHLLARRRRPALLFVPFIDLMLILLMVFMLIIQLSYHAPTDASLDENGSGAGHSGGNQQKEISKRTIKILADGTIILDGRLTDIKQLSALLEAEGSNTPQTAILELEAGVRLKSLQDVLLIVQSVPSLSLRIAMPAEAGIGDAK